MSLKGRFFIPICSLLAFGAIAEAHNPGTLFELDGDSDAANTCATKTLGDTGCDDWDLLNGNGTGTKPGAPGHSLARTFASEPAGVNVFQGGGSKDPLPLASWRWKQGSTPDKDTITNAYAAAYQDSESELNLIFGADRYAVNGSANIGFWFFQDNVYPLGTGSGGFHGTHVNNDLFVVSAFTQGGGYSTITVYAWDNSCTKGVRNPTNGQCADTNLKFLYSSSGSTECSFEGCALVNSADITVTWPYLAKFGSESQIVPPSGFFEGGLDIGTLLPAGTTMPCFTSFLIETRSSQEPSAVLKDFISGTFNVCGMTVTKNCGTNGNAPYVNTGGTSVHYHYDGTVKNIGIGTLYNVTLVDSLPAGAANATFSPVSGIFASLVAGATEAWSVEFDIASTNVNNSAYAKGAIANESPATCETAGTVCSPPSDIATCSITPNNTITISKACGIPIGYPNAPTASVPGTQLVEGVGDVAVRVNFSGEVCNTGQTPLSGFVLTDNPAATVTVGSSTLNPGACTNYSGTYMPTTVTGNGIDTPGRYSFADQIKVTGATAALGPSPGHEVTCTGTFNSNAQACNNKTCHICPSTGTGASCSGE